MNDPQISSCYHSCCLHGSPAADKLVCPRAYIKDNLQGEVLEASQAGSQWPRWGYWCGSWFQAMLPVWLGPKCDLPTQVAVMFPFTLGLHTALRGKIAQMWCEQCMSMRGYNFSFQTCSHSSARGGGKWRWHPLNDGIEPDNVLWFWPCKSRKWES